MTKEKTIDAVAKMIQLTQDEELKWEEVKVTLDQFPNLQDRANLTLLNVFETLYDDIKLRIYQYKYTYTYKKSLSKPDTWGIFPVRPFKNEEFEEVTEWGNRVALEIVGQNNKGLWSFPNVNILDDLYLVVQQQVAGVRTLFEKLLKENTKLLELMDTAGL